jgi:hypothetical protein
VRRQAAADGFNFGEFGHRDFSVRGRMVAEGCAQWTQLPCA